MAELSCPEKQSLAEFAAGRGEAELREAVQDHIDHCQRCRQVLKVAGEPTVEPGHLLADVEDSLLELSGFIGRDVAATNLADESTRLYQTSEELASRFDLSLLEPSQQSGSLGKLGKCDLLEVLGFGGMGIVFRAQDQHLLRCVAIKVMSREIASSPVARRRFLREARAAAAINHPNVVTIHSVEEHNGTPFLVMELLDGETLRDRLRHRPKLELADVLGIAAQIASGLAEAHSHGVIHRDIKPGNVMLHLKTQQVKITDFGLAQVAIDENEQSGGEKGVGTPTYMAPEQVTGGVIDQRTDLFALGCVMYAMLRGHSPFQGASAIEVARKVVDEPPNPPVAAADVPPFLVALIERLLEKTPENRYQSAAEVAELLRNYLAAVRGEPSGGQDSSPGKTRRTRPAFAVLLCAAAAAICGLLAMSGTHNGWFVPPDPRSNDAVASKTVPPDITQPPARLPRVLTVSQGAHGEFQTLAAALGSALPGDTVRIVDDSEYSEALTISEAVRHAGITIEGNANSPPTIVNPGSEQSALHVRNVPGVRLRGLRIRQGTERQHALTLSGEIPGTILEELLIEGESTSWSVVHVTSARGSAEQPIVIQKCRISSPYIGMVIQQGAGMPPAHVHLVGNRWEDEGTQIMANGAADHLRIVGNVFTGKIGVSLGLTDVANSRGLVIASNTFFRCDHWLSLRNTTPDIKEATIINNLVLEPQGEIIKPGNYLPREYAAAEWKLGGNYCEREPPASGGWSALAEGCRTIAVSSRDSADAHFLHPVEPLTPKAPTEPDLPSQVGAMPPLSW